MSRVRTLIEGLRGRTDLGIKDLEQSWVVRIQKEDSVCEITVPHRVLEWFAAVTRDGEEVWSDWMDYCGYDGSPMEKLEADMAEHIAAFVDRISASSSLQIPLSIYEEEA